MKFDVTHLQNPPSHDPEFMRKTRDLIAKLNEMERPGRETMDYYARVLLGMGWLAEQCCLKVCDGHNGTKVETLMAGVSTVDGKIVGQEVFELTTVTEWRGDQLVFEQSQRFIGIPRVAP